MHLNGGWAETGPAAADGTGKLRGQECAVAAEFALVIGLMALVVSSLFELTLLLNQQVVLVQAAREGVRRAIVEGGDTGKVREVIAEQLRAVGMDPGRSAPKWRLGWSC